MIAWVLETFAATTVLMVLVLAVRRPVARHFGPDIAYALWVLPVLRLFMPPLPGAWRLSSLIAPLTQSADSDTGITFGVLNPDHAPQAAIDNALLQAQVELAGRHADLALVPPTPVAGGPGILMLLVGVWLIGAAAFLGYHLIAHRRFCANLMRRARIERTVAEGRVHVIETEAATGPLAFGIWRKYVAFPRDFSERYDPLERNLALAHELGHHLRGDLIANWVALVVLALHWFNPVAWRAFRAFRADQELACDALVLAGRAPALRHAYGRAIVKSAHGGAVSAACHLHTINELKGRLRMLSKHDRKSRTRVTAGVAGATLLSLAGLALTASGTQAVAGLRADVDKVVGSDPLQQVPAAPPAPPEEPAEPAPPAAPAPSATAKTVKKIRIVTRDKDGKVTVTESDDSARTDISRIIVRDGRVITADGKPFEAPRVISARCGGTRNDDVKIESRDGDQRKIVICTDRIERRAADAASRARLAEAMADKHRVMALAMTDKARVMAVARADMGKRHALMSIKMARSTIEAQTSLSAEQKLAALKGLDEAMRELERDAQD